MRAVHALNNYNDLIFHVQYMQVDLKTVAADFITKEVIRTVGGTVDRAAMVKGPQGKIQGKFADGSIETIDYSNLALTPRPKRAAAKKPAAGKRPRSKGPKAKKSAAAVRKKPAVAGPSPRLTKKTAVDQEKGDLEEGEDEEEAEEEVKEAEAEASSVPPPLPAPPATMSEDCSDCDRNILTKMPRKT